MRLAEPVRDRFGDLILEEGDVVSEKGLADMAGRGIASVLVALDQPPVSVEERTARAESIQKRLDFLFRKSMDFPLNARLKSVIFAYRLEQGK